MDFTLLETAEFKDKLFNPAILEEDSINWLNAMTPEEDDDWDYCYAMAFITEPNELSKEEYLLYSTFRKHFPQEWIAYINKHLGADWKQIAELTLEYQN